MKKPMMLMMAAAALLLAGCVREVTYEHLRVGAAEQEGYAPLSRYNLEINLEGKRELVAGSDGSIIFSIQNADSIPVKIPEWYGYEPYNLRVYCQPWLPDMKEPDENAWVNLDPELEHPQLRSSLELAPGNKVLITRKLNFIQGLKVSSTGERRFFIKAELNLTSVDVKSPLFGISVHSPEAMQRRMR